MAKPDTDGIDPDAEAPETENTDQDDSEQSGKSSAMTIRARKVPLPEEENWFKTQWRPAAAWLYLFINLFDFVIAPVLTMVGPKLLGGAYTPWQPLTLVGGGMFHLSFGAIIGVTAWGRTRERVNGLIS